MSAHEHDPEFTECAECGAEFDLARQNYYDNRCPNCVDEKRTWPRCCGCDDKVDPDDVKYKTVRERSRLGGTSRLPYCPDCYDGDSRRRP